MAVMDRSPTLQTARLTLRPLRPADADRAAALAADYAVCSMSARMPYPYGRSDAEAFIDQCLAQDPERDATFAVETQEHGLIGAIGFYKADGEPVELGYWLGQPYWGLGYATEAARAVLAWARSDWGRRRAIASHFVDNPASARVLIKAGFLYTGEVRRRHCRARNQSVPARMMVWLA